MDTARIHGIGVGIVWFLAYMAVAVVSEADLFDWGVWAFATAAAAASIVTYIERHMDI